MKIPNSGEPHEEVAQRRIMDKTKIGGPGRSLLPGLFGYIVISLIFLGFYIYNKTATAEQEIIRQNTVLGMGCEGKNLTVALASEIGEKLIKGHWQMAIGDDHASQGTNYVCLKPTRWDFPAGGTVQTEFWKKYHHVRVRFELSPSKSGQVLGGMYAVIFDDPRLGRD